MTNKISAHLLDCNMVYYNIAMVWRDECFVNSILVTRTCNKLVWDTECQNYFETHSVYCVINFFNISNWKTQNNFAKELNILLHSLAMIWLLLSRRWFLRSIFIYLRYSCFSRYLVMQVLMKCIHDPDFIRSDLMLMQRCFETKLICFVQKHGRRGMQMLHSLFSRKKIRLCPAIQISGFQCFSKRKFLGAGCIKLLIIFLITVL